MGRLDQLFERGRYECPRQGCAGVMIRRGGWRHDDQQTGFAPFGCSRCPYREELVVAHYSEKEELFLHAQRPGYTGRARCPRCGEPMRPGALGGVEAGILRFVCPRCGGARDTLLAGDRRHRAAGTPASVVVVDGDAGRGRGIREVLEEGGAGVEVARDEAEALSRVSGTPTDALVVVDDGSLNVELLLVRGRRLADPPALAILLTPRPELVEAEAPPGAVRLPLPPQPALLTWFVAYAAGGERTRDDGGSLKVR